MTGIVFFAVASLVGQVEAPGIVIAHSPAKTKQYIGSPSLAVLPNGEYVASHDYFGPGSKKNQTVVYGSTNRGQTWSKKTTIDGQWWSTLFLHGGDLYIFGTSREEGACVIRRSNDGGSSWTTPIDRQSGLLHGDGKYHCAPVPIVEHAGRLWRGMEDCMGPGGWGTHFRAFMMSAPVDADLLRADSWTSSERIGRDPAWLGGRFGGWLEGNAVVTPEGKIVDILRVDVPSGAESAAIIEISADGKKATFDPAAGFVPMPGGAKKFSIRFDPKSRSYWTLANPATKPFQAHKPAKVRNTLRLMRSTELKSWQERATILEHPDVEKHGFQYVDWLFDGDDIIAVVRTAFDDANGGAHNQHDANYLTFHRIKNFRSRVD